MGTSMRRLPSGAYRLAPDVRDLGTCVANYCQDPAVVYIFGHSDRLTIVQASDSRAHILAHGEQSKDAGGRCLHHAHDALDELIEGDFRGGPDAQ